MKCPNCGRIDGKHKVIDTRPFKHTIKRKRVCGLCQFKWLTYEATEIEFFSYRNRKKSLPWSAGEEDTLITLHFQGVPKKKIASILGRGRMSVSRKLDKLKASGEYDLVVEKIIEEKARNEWREEYER